MILKALLILGVISIVYLMFIKKKPTIKPQSKNKADKNLKADDMVECASCGVYAPVEESILSGSHYFCSQECLSKGA